MSDTTREIPKLTDADSELQSPQQPREKNKVRQRGNELYALRQKFKGNISLLGNDPNGAAKPGFSPSQVRAGVFEGGSTPPRTHRQIHVQHESSRKTGLSQGS